ncbi:MAG: pyridoxamine 5'-phosphate oxidase family protein [Acidimicrobiales bacterium]
MVEVDRNGLEVLDRSECLRLLSQASLGRVAFTSGALPCVLPVSFQLDDERILVRTRSGGRLDLALRGSVVAFEVDDLDADAHTGWSVSLTGCANAVCDPDALGGARRTPIDRWTSSPDDSLVAISTEVLTGRRVTPDSGPTRLSSSGRATPEAFRLASPR